MRFPLFATGCTLVCVAILCTLGAWQLDRLNWKRGILAEIEAIEKADLALSIDLTARADGTYGMRAGTLSGDLIERSLVVTRGAEKIEYLFMKIADGRIVPVRDQCCGEVGYIRDVGRPNSFVPDNRPPIWHWLDTHALSKDWGVEVLPVEFIGWTPAEGNLPRPNNNHLHYAIFWFAMAGVLVCIYFLRFFWRKKTNGCDSVSPGAG